MEDFKEQSPEHHRLIMPDVSAKWMVELFQQLGMCLSGMNGPQRITWSEIKAFSDSSSALTPWEADTLMEMSANYVGWYHKGGEASCPPPFELDEQDAIEARRKAVAEQFAAMKAQRALKRPR